MVQIVVNVVALPISHPHVISAIKTVHESHVFKNKKNESYCHLLRFAPAISTLLPPGVPPPHRDIGDGLQRGARLQRVRDLRVDLRPLLRRLQLLPQDVHLREGPRQELCQGMGVRTVLHGDTQCHRRPGGRLPHSQARVGAWGLLERIMHYRDGSTLKLC